MNTIKHIPKNEQIRQLEELIVNESNSIEWLLYNSLKAVQKVLNNKSYKPNWDMTYKTDEELNDILVKYSQPIRYFLEKGFTFIGGYSNFNHMDSYNNDCFISNKDMNKFLNKASEIKQVQIADRTPKNNVKPKVICGFINDIFGITGYNLKNKNIDGKTTKGYYDLQPTPYYYDVLKGQIEL